MYFPPMRAGLRALICSTALAGAAVAADAPNESAGARASAVASIRF